MKAGVVLKAGGGLKRPGVPRPVRIGGPIAREYRSVSQAAGMLGTSVEEVGRMVKRGEAEWI